ncbi:TPA: tail fiber assembly protein [Vibrio vulnificus]|uniref:tail fiber assembly protein n=1 Tax=Shewanella algae TaxID=38313 RepID=UPI0031F4CC46
MDKPKFIDGLHPGLKWIEIRKYRDHLIAETDYTQMPDAPLDDAKKAEFTSYRQALRDIPQDFGDPDAIVWPEKPTI